MKYKYFFLSRGIQKVKSIYPRDVIETNNMYKNDNEVNDYFIRRISKKVNEEDEDETISDNSKNS